MFIARKRKALFVRTLEVALLLLKMFSRIQKHNGVLSGVMLSALGGFGAGMIYERGAAAAEYADRVQEMHERLYDSVGFQIQTRSQLIAIREALSTCHGTPEPTKSSIPHPSTKYDCISLQTRKTIAFHCKPESQKHGSNNCN
jgi:hypothetical protein